MTNKIKLSEEQIHFLSNEIKEGVSLYDSISKWNQKQELAKRLESGVMVKIIGDPKWSNYYNRKGFIAKTLVEPGMGFDPEKSGKFSVYLLDGEQPIHGDLIGRLLKPLGEYVEKEFLLDYREKYGVDNFIRDELNSLIEQL
ncbi:MAG: hypothetical protein ACW9W3_01075 [Candidatus Nitrosopumilus sp. bin_68KS]